ncbi:MAG: sigma factor-like helix-turn-helix DNA-binding protein, partial [Flaviflexus sp.]|nr:sigma factor-like helix-turn-helix DNA-binding protein [Flaviflexus sp.]
APPEIQAAHARLVALNAEEVYPGGRTLADILESFFHTLSERDINVLRERTFADHPATLAELGDIWDVTREAIRLVERKAQDALAVLLRKEDLKEIVSLVRQRTTIPTPLAELTRDYPVLEDVVPAVDQPVWRILDKLDESYEIVDGWCAAPTVKTAGQTTVDRLGELADKHGTVPLAAVFLGSNEETGRPAWLLDWLDYLEIATYGESVILATHSMEEYAAAVLSVAGQPMTVDEIQHAIGRGAKNSLRNALGRNPEIVRINRWNFGLTEWGMPEYTSIRDEIAKILEEAGGSESISIIIDSLTDRFGVSPNSVYAYASAPPFKLEATQVTLRAAEDHPALKHPTESAGYYRRGDEWLMADVINSDHLRGSGLLCSSALATIVGLVPGERKVWPSGAGTQSFYYTNTQPALGSVRSELLDQGIGLGEEVFFVFGPGEQFRVELLPPTPGTVLGKALRAIGADPTLEGAAAFAAFAEAVECETDRRAVIGAYLRRGELN